MRNKLFLFVLLMAVPMMMSATPVCVVGWDLVTDGACTLSGLTFGEVTMNNGGGVEIGALATGGGVVNLVLQPDVAIVGVDDVWFRMHVTGWHSAVDLTNAGTGVTSIGERVCDGQGLTINNTCASGQDLLSFASVGSGESAVMYYETPQANVWIFKDLFANTGGHISSFSQSFHIPEPAAMLLVGSGLLGLGLLRRRR